MSKRIYKTQLNKELVDKIENEKDNLSLETLKILHFLIIQLEKNYASSSKKLSWEKVEQSINMMKRLLVDESENINYEKINHEFFEQHHFKQFIEFLYDEGSWEYSCHYILTRVMSEMWLYVFPEEIVKKIELPMNLLLEVNMKMSIRVGWKVSDSIKEKIEIKFKDTDFIDDANTLDIIRFSLKDEQKIESFTIEKKRILTYNEIIEMMKNEIKFWEKLLSRSNLKIPSNKRYIPEMFEFTTEKIKEGFRSGVAYELTLTEFDEDPLKYESYGKRYLEDLKGGNKLPKKRK